MQPAKVTCIPPTSAHHHPWQMAQPYAAMTGLHALHQTKPCVFDLLLLPFLLLAFTRAGLTGSPTEKRDGPGWNTVAR